MKPSDLLPLLAYHTFDRPPAPVFSHEEAAVILAKCCPAAGDTPVTAAKKKARAASVKRSMNECSS